MGRLVFWMFVGLEILDKGLLTVEGLGHVGETLPLWSWRGQTLHRAIVVSGYTMCTLLQVLLMGVPPDFSLVNCFSYPR